MKKIVTKHFLHGRNAKKLLLTMKLTILFLVASMMHVSASVYSQATKFNFTVENEPIVDVLAQIEETSNFRFFFQREQVNVKKTVSFKANNASVESILEFLFKEESISYKVLEDDLILLASKSSLLLSGNSTFLSLKQVEVKGTVKDKEGNSIPGVNVSEAGTSNGTVTDLEGNFSISVADENATLVFSFIGMKTKTVVVGTSVLINVILEAEDVAIDDVVITALGISREKKALGYAVDEVNSDEIALGGTTNFLKNLDGKVTGVNITSLSADPTSSTYVVIRGATSISGVQNRNSSASAQPLYVVDGVAVGTGGINTSGEIDAGNFMSEMSPDDIESVTILKGASATALYGSEGGNGVIVITTKSGKGMQKGIGVSFNSSLTFDQAYKALPVQSEYIAGEEEFEMDLFSKKSWGPYYSDVTGTHNQWDMAKQEFVDEPVTRRNTENPFLAFLQTGMTATNNVSVTGNYDKGNYRMSYTNMVNKGVVPNTKTTRNTVSFDAGYKVNDKLKVSGNVQYINTYAPNKAILAGRGDVKYSSVLYNIVASTADKQPFSDWATPWIEGSEGLLQNVPYLDFEDYLGNGDETDRANYRPYKGVNPYFIAEEIINTFSRESFIGKVQVEYDIIDNLKLTGRTGLNSTIFHYQKRYPWNINKYLLDGRFDTEDSENSRINTDIFLTYSKTFGKFSVDALGGYNFRISNNQYTRQGGDHLARPNDFSISAISKDDLSTSYSWSTGKYSSLYGTASVGFNNMLYLDLSVRQDYVGITELEKNSSFYPGGSLSWIVSESIKLPSWVNMLKLRGGVAQVGYGIPTYLNVDNYGFSSTWNGTTVGTVYGSVVNPEILPEVNTTYEGGIDARFLNSRVNFNFTVFQKVHANQIQDIPIVSSSGFSSYRTNIGTVTSDGLELALTVVPVRTNDWEWSVSANFTKYVATITELDPAFTEKWIGYGDGSMLRLKEGEEIGSMYAEEGFWRVQSGMYKGQIMLKPDTGTPIENDDPDNRDYLGNMNPEFMMGFTTQLKYKSFSLSMVMSYRNGGVYVSETAKRMNDDGKTPWSLSGDGNYWEGGRSHNGGYAWPDPNNVAFDVVREYNEANGFLNEASYWNGVYVDPSTDYDSQDRNLPDDAYVLNGEDPNSTWYAVVNKIVGNTWDFPQTRTFDATYFKIRNIELRYDIPKIIAGKIKMQAASVSFIARNVYLWTKSGRNEDPETAFSGSGTTQGVAHYTLPSVRQLGFKLNLTF